MAQRVYVHIGAPKTGSTFLQGRLFANQAALAEQGICLPGRLIEHFQSKLFLTGQLEEEHGHPARANTAWQRLLAEIRDWPGTALLTHELFAGLDDAAVQRMLDYLAPADVHLIYAARDLMRQIPAEWQEHIKHGWRVPFHEFVEDLMAEGPSSTWFRQVQDPPRVLERWSALPGAHRHLVVVPPPDSDPELLWQQFASIVGFDPSDMEADDVFVNESLGTAEAELVRRVNKYAVPRLLEEGRGQVPRWIKTELAHSLLSQRPDPHRLTVNPEYRAWIVRRSEKIVDELKSSDLHITGDLDDLIPKDLDQPAGDPAAVPDDELLDVSLETISELLIRLRRTTLELRASEQRVRQITEERDRLAGTKQRLSGEIQRRQSRPLKQMLIDTSEQHPSLHRMRRSYWQAANTARRLRGQKQPEC
ncbi:MAG: hypothetical protein GEU93_08775 [Propionibacteriales bacterium]|nr:hypothetical protein [Propionibacteriales bacterium]